MAIIKAVSSKASIRRALNYIINPEKTELQLVSSLNCYPYSAIEEMEVTKLVWGKTQGRQYYHFIQSFSPEENLTPQLANDIAVKLAEQQFENFQVVISTHQDRDHIHTHFILNSVNSLDGYKLNWSKHDLQNMKDASDLICLENNLSIIEKPTAKKRYTQAEQGLRDRGQKPWKDVIREAVEFELVNSTDYDDFKNNLSKNHSIEIKERGQTVTYRMNEMNRAVRGRTLGMDYELNTISNIRDAIAKELERFENLKKLNDLVDQKQDIVRILDQDVDDLNEKTEDQEKYLEWMDKEIFVSETKVTELEKTHEMTKSAVVQEKQNLGDLQAKTSVLNTDIARKIAQNSKLTRVYENASEEYINFNQKLDQTYHVLNTIFNDPTEFYTQLLEANERIQEIYKPVLNVIGLDPNIRFLKSFEHAKESVQNEQNQAISAFDDFKKYLNEKEKDVIKRIELGSEIQQKLNNATVTAIMSERSIDRTIEEYDEPTIQKLQEAKAAIVEKYAEQIQPIEVQPVEELKSREKPFEEVKESVDQLKEQFDKLKNSEAIIKKEPDSFVIIPNIEDLLGKEKKDLRILIEECKKYYGHSYITYDPISATEAVITHSSEDKVLKNNVWIENDQIVSGKPEDITDKWPHLFEQEDEWEHEQ